MALKLCFQFQKTNIHTLFSFAVDFFPTMLPFTIPVYIPHTMQLAWDTGKNTSHFFVHNFIIKARLLLSYLKSSYITHSLMFSCL